RGLRRHRHGPRHCAVAHDGAGAARGARPAGRRRHHGRRLDRPGSARRRRDRARPHPRKVIMLAIIATADGRYRDPWHPFDETTPALAGVLSEAGFETHILPVDEALDNLTSADLLAVNAGDPWRHDPLPLGAPRAAIHGLDAALGRG